MEVRVLIVGAGPTGLLLAAELWRRGVACRLIDANPAPLHWDRATVIHPRSLEVFDALGLHERFLAAGVPQRFARLHSSGAVLGEIDLSRCGSRYGFNLGLSEEVTEAVLTDFLHAHGGAVTRASRLVGLRTNDAGVVATIERRDTTEEVHADWVVGCDGLHSATRELSGIALAGHDIAEPWAVFDVTLGGWAEPYEAIFAYLDAPPVILTALPGRRWRAYLRPTAEDADLVADAAATLGRYHPRVTLDDVANPTRFHCHSRVATRFRAGRVLLAGDAAHVCSPFQGHGMNTGLQDAFNLGWKLALVCKGHSPAAILDSYEIERRPVAEAVAASGDEVEHAQTLTDPAERRARDAALRATFADPRARHHEAIAEAELDIDYGGSPIVLGEAGRLGPGQRLPDTIAVRLPDRQRELGLYAFTHGPSHVALLVGGPTLPDEALERIHSEIFGTYSPVLIDALLVLTASPGSRRHWQLRPGATEQLGVDGVTLLVVRPDGHVGLRADRDHVAALASYQDLLLAR